MFDMMVCTFLFFGYFKTEIRKDEFLMKNFKLVMILFGLTFTRHTIELILAHIINQDVAVFNLHLCFPIAFLIPWFFEGEVAIFDSIKEIIWYGFVGLYALC